MIKYKEIIISNFQIILHNRYLWFFGLFAAFLSNSGVYKSLYGDTSNNIVDDWLALKETGIFSFSIFSKIIEAGQEDLWGLLLRLSVLAVVFLLAVFILWLSIVSKGALVNNIAQMNFKKPADFRGGMKSGRKNFWPVFFFKVGEKIVVVIFLLAALLFVLLTSSYAENSAMLWFYYSFLAILFFITFLVSLVINYGIASQIIKGTRFVDSLQTGFKMLKNNLLNSVEAGIVIFIVNFILSFAALVIISAIAIPFIFLIFLFYKISFLSGLNFVLFAGAFSLFAIIAIVGGILASFTESFWTIIFLILSRAKPDSWIKNLFAFKKKEIKNSVK
ncbi:MAG: hypothetical protein WC323_03740 [Patescibacteria group bacterium]|jgi:hypothetical protein